MALGFVGIEVGTTHPDDGGHLQLVVELLRPGRHGHLVERSDDGRGVGEVEDGELVPVGLHLQPAPLPGGPDVLLEGVEVPDRRWGVDRGVKTDGSDFEHLLRLRAGPLTGLGESPSIAPQEVHQADAGLERMDRIVDDEPHALSSLAVGERGPAHWPECSGVSLGGAGATPR